MHLHEIDLNLLLVFDELRRQRRVSATAQALGLSQPGVSNALNRLRKLLGDELFLRTPRGMSPTPYAEQLTEPIAHALSTLREALGTRAHFDPASATATLTVAVTDVGEIYFLSDLMRELARQAPGVVLNTRRSTDAELKTDMERGLIDLALGFLPNLKAGFVQRRLFEQPYVCLVRHDHPLTAQPLTRAAFEQADHVQVAASGTGHHMVDDHLSRAGVQRNVRLRVPHFMAVAQVLQATHLVAVVPARFADKVVEPFGLRALPCPIAIPQTAIHAIWHAQKQRDPASRWLRELVVRLFAEHPDPP